MTENTSETENLDRSKIVRQRVFSILRNAFDEMHRTFDALDTEGIAGTEIVEALREIGEEEIRENYAAWAEIDIREDDATTMDDVVPDPADAGSYTNWTPRWIGPVSPLEDEFTGWDLLRHVIDEFPKSYVDQTGGGTATFVIRKTDTDVAITAGPGSYNWTDPKASVFYTGEFYFGRDTYDNDGNEYPDEDPGEALDPENPGTLVQLADRIRAVYNKHNAPKES